MKGSYRWSVNPGGDITHWGRVTHICVSILTTFGLNNSLSPGRCQVIIWTNVGILWIGPLRINVSEILIEINAFSHEKMHVNMSTKCHLFPLGHSVLTLQGPITHIFVCMRDPAFVVSDVSAYAPAHNGSRPSAGVILITTFGMCSSMFTSLTGFGLHLGHQCHSTWLTRAQNISRGCRVPTNYYIYED